MKLLIVLATLLGSASAFACAGFTGTWTCKGKEIAVQMDQTADGWVMKNPNGSEAYMLDGVQHEVAEPTPHTYQGSCNDTTINLSVNFTEFNIQSTQMFTLVDANTMNVDVTAFGQSGQITCTK